MKKLLEQGNQVSETEDTAESEQKIKDKDNLPLEEQVFEQLADFSEAVRDVQNFMQENPEASRQEVIAVLENHEFTKRQHEYFLKGIETLFNKRETIARAIDVYKERFGEEEYEEAMFKEIFSSSGTFGDITLIPDKDSLIFMCDHHLDVAQGIHKEGDVYADFEESEMSLEELPSSSDMGLPLGAFFADPDLDLEEVGSVSEMVILINKSGFEEGDTESDIDKIVEHEKQHAENSLYLRPRRQMEGPQKVISESVDGLEIMIQTLEIETLEVQQEITKAKESKGVLLPDEIQEIFAQHLKAEQREKLKQAFEKSLEEIAAKLEEIVAYFQKTSIEATVKEELLAYYFSGTSNEDINDIIPIYVTKLKAAVGNIRLTFEKMLLKYYPNDLLEELGVENPEHRRLTLSFRQLRIETKGTPRGKKDEDAIGRSLAKAEEALDHFEENCSQSTEDGLEFFRKIDQEAGEHSDELRKMLKPMIISQPMEKWEGLFKKALEKIVQDKK